MIEANEAWGIIAALIQARGPAMTDQYGPYISLEGAIQIIAAHADGLEVKIDRDNKGRLNAVTPIFKATTELEARDDASDE